MPVKKSSKKKNKKQEFKRNLEYKDDDGQEYGKIIKALGCAMFEVKCYDGKTRLCKARSKRLRVRVNQYVIISLRDFDDKRGDIIYVYTADEEKILKKQGIFNQNLEPDNEKDNDGNFIFEEEDIDINIDDI